MMIYWEHITSFFSAILWLYYVRNLDFFSWNVTSLLRLCNIYFFSNTMAVIRCHRIAIGVRERQLLQCRASDTSKRSLILISSPKGHMSDRVGHYWSVWFNLFTFISISMAHTWQQVDMLFEPRHWQPCPCRAPFRSIPAPENVPRGSWLLDDHVLQRHPLPLHLLTHLQPFPADGWEHEVSHSISLSLTHTTPSSFILCSPFVRATVCSPLAAVIDLNVSPEQRLDAGLINQHRL